MPFCGVVCRKETVGQLVGQGGPDNCSLRRTTLTAADNSRLANNALGYLMVMYLLSVCTSSCTLPVSMSICMPSPRTSKDTPRSVFLTSFTQPDPTLINFLEYFSSSQSQFSHSLYNIINTITSASSILCTGKFLEYVLFNVGHNEWLCSYQLLFLSLLLEEVLRFHLIFEFRFQKNLEIERIGSCHAIQKKTKNC